MIVELREGSSLSVARRWKSINGFAAEITAANLEQLEHDPNVVSITADLPGGGALAESVPLIGGNLVRGMGYTGAGVTVAVLDSGIARSHPDFAGAVVDEHCNCRNSDGTGCCPNGQVEQSGPGAAADDHGHGTAVSGVLAGRGAVASFGVAPGVQIVAVKVLDRNNRFAGTSQVLSGLDWLMTNHPEVRVVNMSLLTDSHFAGSCDGLFGAFRQAIETLRSRGTLVFACSGNTGSASSMGSPACVSATVAVGAVWDAAQPGVDCGGSIVADRVTCFSDSDPTLDLLAPGALIRTSGFTGGTLTTSGTSFASPHAAGAAAVLIGLMPSLTAEQVESLLKATGKRLVDSKNGIVTPRVDVFAAVQSLLTPHPRRRAVAP